MLEPNPNALYLDCGCHAGLNSKRLGQRVSARSIVGIDYNEQMLAGALKYGVRVARCDVNKPLPFRSEAFDVVTALDVIEHIVETAAFVAELYRVITPGGYLIIDTPNLASWHNIFALLLGIQPFSGPNITTMIDADLDVVRAMHRHAHQFEEEGEIADESERELRRHLVVLAYRSALKLLRQRGFHIELGLGYGYLPFPPILGHLLSQLDPAHSHHMVIKARKPT